MSFIKQPSEILEKKNLVMLVYGSPGDGKTTLAISAPKPVLLDMDGGVGRTLASHRCPVVQGLNGKPLPWAPDPANKANGQDEPSVLGALDEIRSLPFDTVVVDTVGKLLDAMSDSLMRTNPALRQRDGSLSLKGYGARKRMFKDFVSQCLAMGKNVVFIAHAQRARWATTSRSPLSSAAPPRPTL